MVVFVLFFKQKTAYEMRISDWSSDVCSSDLFYWTAMIRGVGLVTGLIFQVVVMRAPTAAMLHVAITAGMANLTTLVFLTWITAPPPGLGGPTLTFAEIGRASWRERVCQYV